MNACNINSISSAITYIESYRNKFGNHSLSQLEDLTTDSLKNRRNCLFVANTIVADYYFNELPCKYSYNQLDSCYMYSKKTMAKIKEVLLARRGIVTCTSIKGQVQTIDLHEVKYKPHRNSLGFTLHGVMI